MTIKKEFAASVHESRIALGYTQEQIAEELSISARWYQKIENGKELPGGLLMLKLIKFLDIDVSRFEDLPTCLQRLDEK